jgi:hypothetical protein
MRPKAGGIIHTYVSVVHKGPERIESNDGCTFVADWCEKRTRVSMPHHVACGMHVAERVGLAFDLSPPHNTVSISQQRQERGRMPLNDIRATPGSVVYRLLNWPQLIESGGSLLPCHCCMKAGNDCTWVKPHLRWPIKCVSRLWRLLSNCLIATSPLSSSATVKFV